jgi:hypothetical protein
MGLVRQTRSRYQAMIETVDENAQIGQRGQVLQHVSLAFKEGMCRNSHVE